MGAHGSALEGRAAVCDAAMPCTMWLGRDLDRLQQRVQIKFHAPSAPLVERISTSHNRPRQQHDRIAAVRKEL